MSIPQTLAGRIELITQLLQGPIIGYDEDGKEIYGEPLITKEEALQLLEVAGEIDHSGQ